MPPTPPSLLLPPPRWSPGPTIGGALLLTPSEEAEGAMTSSFPRTPPDELLLFISS